MNMSILWNRIQRLTHHTRDITIQIISPKDPLQSSAISAPAAFAVLKPSQTATIVSPL